MIIGLRLNIAILLLAISAHTSISFELDDYSQVPFLLQLRDKQGAFLCAATLIAPQYAITAAECFNKLDFSEVTVVAMALKITDPGIQREVAQIYKHPKKIVNIAILKLNEPLADIKVLTIADRYLSEEEFENESFHIVGWHHLSRRMAVKKTLYITSLGTVPYDKCEMVFFAVDVKKIFCLFGTSESVAEICCADAGGPVYADGKLYGVISKGYNCAESDYLLSVTSVFENLSFIQDVIG